MTPPPLVQQLMEQGCYWAHSEQGNIFAMDEGSALLRYYVDLLRAGSPEANDALAATHHAVCSASLARYEPQLVAPLACAKGCSYCCHQHVSVSAVEVFSIARHIRAAPDRPAVMTRLERRLSNRFREPGRDYDIRNPCAFLIGNGSCSIHPIRPAICRIYVSGDVGACRKQLAEGTGTIPVPVLHHAIRGWLTPALWSALEAAGLPVRDYELMGAVNAVLADARIETRWYAGDDALADYSSDEETAGPDMVAEIAAWRAMAEV